MDIGRFSMLRGAKSTPNRFGYKSRFYDKDKEEFDKRIQGLDRDLSMQKGQKTDSPTGGISFSRRASGKEYREDYKKYNSRSNMTIIGLVLILCTICYYVMKLAKV